MGCLYRVEGPSLGRGSPDRPEPAQGLASLELAGAAERELSAGAALGPSEHPKEPDLPGLFPASLEVFMGKGGQECLLARVLAEQMNFKVCMCKSKLNLSFSFMCWGLCFCFKRALHSSLRLLYLYIQKSPQTENILLSPCTNPPRTPLSERIGQTVFQVSSSGATEGLEEKWAVELGKSEVTEGTGLCTLGGGWGLH